MAKTLSTQATDELAERIERLAEAEGRNRSQMVSAAVEFWAQLSPEAHFAIGRIQAMGDEPRALLIRQIERQVLDVQFAEVRRRLAQSMTVPDAIAAGLGSSSTDDAFLDAAVAAVAAGDAFARR